MWKKTFIGLILGLVLSWTLALNATLYPIWPRPLGMLVGLIGGFFVIAGVQTWVYCAPDLKRVFKVALPTLVVSVAANAVGLAVFK